MTNLVTDAKALAHQAHAGQTDKAGRPYIEHAARVAAQVAFWPEAETVAWLHDVVEDHPEYGKSLARFPTTIRRAVGLLDRNRVPNGTNYYTRIQGNTLAFTVKLADIQDNADEQRLSALDSATAQRLRDKYARAKEHLGAGSITAAD